MASIRQEIDIASPADEVWAAVRDVGAVHRRLLPGRVADVHLEDDVRTLTFPDGHTVRELVVDVDDDARRLAYAVVGGSDLPLTHHHATLQVSVRDDTRSRLIWVTDVLPHHLAAQVRLRMQVGAAEMRQALENPAGR